MQNNNNGPSATLQQLRAAAAAASVGNARESESLLLSAATASPRDVVQIATSAMRDVVSNFDAATANPQSEVARIGPFLMLVAARLFHGGIARDFDTYWSTRLNDLRSVRQTLQDFLTHPAIHGGWLMPALNEVAVAWAVTSKLLLLAHDGGNCGANDEVPSQALDFVLNEWCLLLTSVTPTSDGSKDNGHAIRTSPVYLALLRQCVEECGLSARSSLGRGLPLDAHETVRQSVFEHVLPRFLCVVAESILSVAAVIDCTNSNSNNGKQHELLRLLQRLLELMMCVLSWGPSIHSSEFGSDRVPNILRWPALRFRRCLLAKNVNFQSENISSNSSDRNNNGQQEPGLLLVDATLAAFRLGLTNDLRSEISQPAAQCLVQLCSVDVQPDAIKTSNSYGNLLQQLQNQNDNNGNENTNNNNGEPDDWQPSEAAYWLHEASRALLSFCAFRVFEYYLPDPSLLARGAGDIEEAIEIGGALLRQVAIGCTRLTLNAVHRQIVIVPQAIATFPQGVISPMREFAVNTIRYAHELAKTVRIVNGGGSAAIQEEAQVEEVFAETIDFLLTAWRDFVRIALDDLECRAALSGSPLEESISSGANAVFTFFVQSRVLFGVADEANGNNNNGNNNNGNARPRSLVASSIEAHGIDFTLSQISTVGLLGRQRPRSTCELLSGMLGQLAMDYLAAVKNSGSGGGGPGGPTQQQSEAVWYLFHIVSWFVADDDNSSTDIPAPIVDLAVATEREALNAGAHNADDPNFLAQLEERIPVFALARGTLYFCRELMQIVDNNDALRSRISPLLITALLGFFRRYVQNYVDPDSSRTTEANNCRVFATAFNGGVTVAEAAVDFLSWSLRNFYREAAAMKEAGELAYALAAKKNIGPWLMSDDSRCGTVCAAAAGETAPATQFMPQGARLRGEHRGALAGALISACESDAMVDTALKFLRYFVSGFSGPVEPNNFAAVADTVASISNLLSHAKCIHQLGTIVESSHGYLDEVVSCVTKRSSPNQQSFELLANLLELFLNGIEICSFNLSTEVIAWMLQSSVEVIEMSGAAIRFSVEHVLPRLGTSQQRSEQEYAHLRLLKSAAALILAAAQWGSFNFAANEGPSGDRREEIVGTLCVDGLLLVLREARHTDLIESQELSQVVFRLMREVAQTHTRQFLGVSQEHASVLLDATHWALHSADPELIRNGFFIIEAITVAPQARERMARLLNQFLVECCDAIVGGTAFEQSVQVALANAVFALGVALGIDALCNTFLSAVARTPLLARDGVGRENKFVQAFAEAMRDDLLQRQSRQNRRLFASLLRRIVMTVRSANIFS